MEAVHVMTTHPDMRCDIRPQYNRAVTQNILVQNLFTGTGCSKYFVRN